MLPTLSRINSPNYSSRNGARVRLICVHDCEGSYGGSIAWFKQAASQVSAHLVLSEDGQSATQMVDWKNKAWHACAFNSVSEGIEAAGYSAKGLGAPEWLALAAITAFRLKSNGLPPIWAEGGGGEGFCQHRDLGAAGGGHFDISPNPAVWQSFIDMVRDAYSQPMPESWGLSATASRPPPPAPGWTANPAPRHDLSPPSLDWVQAELNAMGIPLVALTVDGLDGPNTQRAVSSFQARAGIRIDGDAGPQTVAALQRAAKLSGSL